MAAFHILNAFLGRTGGDALLLKVDAAADSEGSLQLFGALLTIIFMLGVTRIFLLILLTSTIDTLQ